MFALLATLAFAVPTIAPDRAIAPGPLAQVDPGLRFAAIPDLSYSSDVGFSLGGGAFLYRPGGAGAPQERLSLGVSYTTRGPRTLNFQWNQPRLGGGAWGGLVDLRLADDRHEPYWGEGGALAGSAVQAGAHSPPLSYRFHDRRLFLSVTARPASAARPTPYGRVRLLGIDVRDQGPVLAVQQPLGFRGGSSLLWETGLFLDRRDREVGTRKGAYANASAFAAPAFGPLGPGSFGGFDLAASGYWPVLACATVAARALLDVKLGSVPFFERDQYEGIAYGGGLGGSGTLRGVARSRMAGDEKGLATVEFRLSACEGRPFGSRLLRMGVAVGMDAGFAHQRGHSTLGAVGGFAGLRALWDDAVLVRAEIGYAGQGPAFYLVTGEQF